MKSVPEYIRSLLFEHDYVTVPTLGAFIGNYQSADFNEMSGYLMPPQKNVAFNEILKQDDGLLAVSIARHQNISVEEARKIVHHFVHEVKTKLYLDNEFDLKRIGKFSLNKDNNLVFEPDRKSNFYSESFGFESLFPRKSVHGIQWTADHFNIQPSLTNHAAYHGTTNVTSTIQPNQEIENKSNTFDYLPNDYLPSNNKELATNSVHVQSKKHTQPSNWMAILYAIPLIFLTLGLSYILLYSDDTSNSSLSSVIPFLKKDSILGHKKIDSQKTQALITEQDELIKPVLKSDKVVEEAKIVEKIPPIVVNKPLKEENNKQTSKENGISDAEKPDQIIKVLNKRFKIIAGLFRSKGNSEKQRQRLIDHGFTHVSLASNVKKTNSPLIYVIAETTDDATEAKKLAKKVSEIIGEEAGIEEKTVFKIN